MGSKTAAAATGHAAGAPVVPGTEHGVTLEKRARSHAKHGYPVMLKAAAGGGGKGMRRVDREADLEAACATPRAKRSGPSATPKSTSRS